MRLLVCGGRTYGYKVDPCTNKLLEDNEVWHDSFVVLDNLLKSYLSCMSLENQLNTEVTVIQGGAKGADYMAKVWAKSRGCKDEEYRANWQLYGKAAGYRRNAEMLKEGKPDKVLAFKGGKGTLMMVGIAEKAGVEVIKYGWEDQ